MESIRGRDEPHSWSIFAAHIFSSLLSLAVPAQRSPLPLPLAGPPTQRGKDIIHNKHEHERRGGTARNQLELYR